MVKVDPKLTPNKDAKDGKNDKAAAMNTGGGMKSRELTPKTTPNKGGSDQQQGNNRGGGGGGGRGNHQGGGGGSDRDRKSNRGGRFDHGRGGRGGSNNMQRQSNQKNQHSQQQDGGGASGEKQEGDDLTPQAEKKFTGRCRLFVGNLPNDTSEEDFKKMFEPYGESTEIFLNASRGFGFIRMDLRKNAEAAKQALDGLQKKGRVLRVRFATHGAALRVKYLNAYVTNELLMNAFGMFGEVERAVVIVDDRGKPTGEGIVEFARKPGAQAALKRISEGVFMLTSSPRPIAVEPLEQKDEEDGLPEKFAQKTGEYIREREQVPRFAAPGSFEFEFGQKWKDLYVMHEDGDRTLKRQFEEGTAKLEIDQAGAMMEHQTAMLRQDLMRRQEELRRLEEQHQLEMQRRLDMRLGGNNHTLGRRQDDDRRRQDEEQRRQQEMEMRRQQEERRQQELYRQQERAMREMRGEQGGRGNAPPMQPPPAPPAGLGIEQSRRSAAGMGNQGGMGGGNMENMGSGNQGFGGANANNMASNMPQRQSRFDQPPGFSNQGGNMGMGSGGNMMGSMGGGGGGGSGGGGGGASGGGGGGGGMGRGPMGGQERGGRREGGMQGMRGGASGGGAGGGGGGAGGGGGDEYFEAKRLRRF